MAILPSDYDRIRFKPSVSAPPFHVIRLSGREAISELFHFDIEMISPAPPSDIVPDDLVGQPARIEIDHEAGTRLIHGIVSRFEYGAGVGLWSSSAGASEVQIPCRVELVPTVWFLTQRYKCRMFQGMRAPDIIKDILEKAGLTSDQFRIAVKKMEDFPEREYCVQYRETDYNFIARLMEEEGIFFTFEHEEYKDVFVLGNTPEAHTPIAGDATVLFRGRSGAVEGEEFIYDFRYSQQVRPGKVAVKDYNFKNTSLGLLGEDEVERNPELEVYDYPGLYDDDDLGKRQAELRLEASQARRLQTGGMSGCARLEPGREFDLEDHPHSAINTRYLLTSVRHEAVQPTGPDAAGGETRYDNQFRAIPADIPFRPQRITPKPVVKGPQTAVVTGPSTEEIYVDEYGRVKVHFFWDRESQRDEKSSCWIRVSQLWAGKNWGAMWIPRIGHEVVVDFLEGDPDRPLIVGRVYNGENMPPYPLDDEKTKSTIKSDSSKGGNGSNEIRFEDLKGKEEVYIHCQKDFTIKTENDKNQNTGHDETLTIGNDRTKTVKHDETTTVENDRTETVNGNETITIKGDRTEEVLDGDEKVTIKTGDRTIDVNTGDNTLNVKTGDHTVNVNTGDYTLNVKTGDKTVNVNTGNDTLNVKTGSKTDTIKGPYDITVQSGQFSITCGGSTLTMKLDGSIELKGAAGKLSIGSSGIEVEGMNVKSKATMANDTTGQMVSSAGQAKNTIQGGMVLINP